MDFTNYAWQIWPIIEITKCYCVTLEIDNI